ncbi:MAG: hypothetical protein IE883_04470 [Epsilonproteobacteria bacterium]|nr:hypothetical protein [Campylobacterota bacterium]
MKTLILVGHNPKLSKYVNYFSRSDIENVPKCGVATIQLKHNNWKTIGKNLAELLSFLRPKEYHKKIHEDQ